MKKVITIEPANAHQPKKRLRVAAYCRVSSSMADQLVSLDAQKAHYEEYITSNPEWEFAGLYYDEGISGTKKEKRPALLQMMTDCENGKIDFIVTKSLSRFARNADFRNFTSRFTSRRRISIPVRWKQNCFFQ